MYQVPNKYYFRIHHVRSRFKGNCENVLQYMASIISELDEMKEEEFAKTINESIKLFPGNYNLTTKSVNNWRTEISALFGFFISENGKSRPGNRAKELAENGDLVGTFKYFLYNFQYPGAHIKPHKVGEQIEAGIKFKPAQYLLKLLRFAERIEVNGISI